MRVSAFLATFALAAGSSFFLTSCGKKPEVSDVGSVKTTHRWFGPADSIQIESFKDPAIDGITVFVSKSKTGGLMGAVGLAEDTSDASIAVRQTGPIVVKEKLKNGDEIFSEKRNLLFKNLKITRFYDEANKTFIYLVHSDKLIEGSPKNALSAVVAEPWGNVPANLGPMVPQPQ